MQNQNFKKPSYAQQQKTNHNAPAATNHAAGEQAKGSNPAVKITGLFKSERSKGYEVKVTEEVAAKLKDIKVGSYLKVYENKSEKTGTEYLSLSVKTLA